MVKSTVPRLYVNTDNTSGTDRTFLSHSIHHAKVNNSHTLHWIQHQSLISSNSNLTGKHKKAKDKHLQGLIRRLASSSVKWSGEARRATSSEAAKDPLLLHWVCLMVNTSLWSEMDFCFLVETGCLKSIHNQPSSRLWLGCNPKRPHTFSPDYPEGKREGLGSFRLELRELAGWVSAKTLSQVLDYGRGKLKKGLQSFEGRLDCWRFEVLMVR